MRVREEREDEETAELCRLNSAAFQAELKCVMREKLQIELLRAAVSETKLSLRSSLNDHMGLYITMLIEGGGVATAVRGAENELNTDTSASRRDDTSLQGTATSTAAAREAGEDVMMRVMLPQLIDTAVFNLAFLIIMKTAAASQRCLLLTRKHQNKPLIILQE
ncbi:uncharacterized protein BDCG_00871 [Blastomyces dermatitidis ER-3]|uniref:Uncharacterized protein n=1 Tax=Ajellomyces dermatitidis (strain ER-3 / ATCC MYA-2586) TaxID=559297 RepID=A0ABP2EPB9_AJEDR|nr:uncharacterized protein BDCG_00871 [Blastomyces dermatitidis ER-3]EEQ84066.1 hypothetical protein BDCG_00871 [Blastomyces dermatitidis ER-3]